MQILVLGMHRSGTSAVARLLNMMGAYFAPEGVSTGANEQNPKGFWERRDVRALNDKLLHAAGTDWHLVSDFSIDQVPEATLAEFKQEAGKIILAMDANRPWFLKEPRFCLLLPLWLDLLEMPVCLFVYRSPLEVARSLQTRNGFPLTFSLALWEVYNSAALNATRGRPRIQVNHADLMADPVSGVRSLLKDLKAAGVRELEMPSEEEIRAFIDPSLHRAKESKDSSIELTKAQKELRDAFESGSALPSTQDFVLSDSSRETLIQHDQAVDLEKRIVALEQQNAKTIGDAEKKIAALEQQNATLSVELLTTRTQLSEKAQQLKTVREEAARKGAVSREIQEALGRGIELLRKDARSEAEVLRLREEIKNQTKAIGARQASLNLTIARRDAALAEQRTKVEELSERNRILKQGLDLVEENFRKLRDSRWFHFAIYTVRRLGLASRNPRRWVDSIKDQFPATRRALRQVSGFGPPAKRTEQSTAHRQLPTPDAAKASDSTQTREPDNADREKLIAAASAFRTAAAAKNAVTIPAKRSPADESVCFVVLHRAGEHHLRNLLSSFLKVNTFRSVEFRFVLHACTDGSRQVLESFQDRFPIHVSDHPGNNSFAYSNNRAAEQASAEYLIFLNNDVIFQDDIVSELLRCLQDPRNGLVGLRLLFPPDDCKYPLGIQHAGIKFRPDPAYFFHRPFNLGVPVNVIDTPRVQERFPAVTAALLGCRRREFLEVGGFCEDYVYGYEDVDLGLCFQRLLHKRSVSANQLSCIHNESATGRLDAAEAVQARRLNNIGQLVRRHGWYLRRQIFLDTIRGHAFFSDAPLTVAFAVTEATAETTAGDFFSASELANACSREFGWSIRFLSRKEDWYNLKDVDVLVVLLDAYDLTQMRDAKPDLVKVAWLRNWFERWASHPCFEEYDLFLCSSKKSAQWLRETHRKQAWVFPLATNPERFAGAKPEPRLRSDYCFTGSYWQFEREIEAAAHPGKLDGYEFAVFGQGWENHPSLSSYAKGFLPYSEMPKVYASTRLVVDDANHVTKQWGSVNSRVFDALVSGVLVVTNGGIGADEVFDGELPVYRSPAELRSLIRHYLGNDHERQELVRRLRQSVLDRHTYRHRARSLKRILLTRARRKYRIACKIGAPTRAEIQHWGDYHFARSLGRCFAAQGHSFRVDCLDEWERPESFGDDVAIVLRGLSRYRPKTGQINLMWNISHPDKVQDEEYDEFDHVFIASSTAAGKVASRIGTSVSPLLQCTDPHLFYPDPNADVPAEEILFVGNSRKQYREAVQFAVQAEMPIGVYGTHWPMFIPERYIRGQYIDNSVLRQHYSRSSILLNDHWPSMREQGFISNRIFDAAATGAFVLSDVARGIEQLFGEDLATYDGEGEFRELVKYYLEHPDERREKAARLRKTVLEDHTFAHRAAEIEKRIRELDSLKQSGETLREVTTALIHA